MRGATSHMLGRQKDRLKCENLITCRHENSFIYEHIYYEKHYFDEKNYRIMDKKIE